MLRAMLCSCASSSAESSRPVKTTTGTSDRLGSFAIRSSTSKPDMSGSRRSSTTQSQGCSRSAVSAPAPVPVDDDLDVVVAEQLADAHLLGGIVLDDQQALAPRLRVVLDARQRRLEAFGRRRLGHEGEGAAREPVLAVLVERDDLHRDVARERVLLELAQHRPAEHVGQEHVERDRGRLVLLGELERLGAAHGDQHLEALVAGQIHEDAGIVRIVLDDQQDAVARLEVAAGRPGSARPGVPRRRTRQMQRSGQRVASVTPARAAPVAGPTYLSGR